MDFSLIKAPFKFFKVTAEMLCAYLMIRTNNGAPKQTPDAFNPIRVNVAPYPLLSTVIDTLVLSVSVSASVVAGIVVSVNVAGICMGRFRNEAVKHLRVASLLALPHPKIDLAAAFQRSENHGLIPDIARPNVTAPSADIGFIHFNRSDNAADLRRSDLRHGLADTVAAMFPFMAILNGYTLRVLWGWFIVPVFHLPLPSVAQSIGIAMVVTYLTSSSSSTKKSESWWEPFATMIARPVFALFFGWVVSHFV